MIAIGLGRVARVMHVAAGLDDLRLVGFEIEVEMGERVVLDGARAVAQARRIPAAASTAAARRPMKLRAKRQRALQAARRRAPSCALSLKCGRGGDDAHGSAALGRLADRGSSVMPASTSATWRTFTGLPSRCSLPGHVHQAAEIAGEQEVGAGGDDLGAFSRDDRVGDFAVFDRERAAEAAADVGASRAASARGRRRWRATRAAALHAELAQARAGIVIGRLGVARRDARERRDRRPGS